MKSIYIILTFATFISMACKQHQKTKFLDSIDTLIVEEHYDSAYREVQKIDEKSLSNDFDRAHYHLLQIQTSYITSNPVPADSIIRETINYYEKTQNKELLAEAYYYRGVIYYESQQNQEAVAYLKKAQESAMKTDNKRLKYKIAKSLSIINRDASNYNLQLSYAEEAYQTAREADNKKWMVYALYHICCAYSNMMDMKNARKYADAMLPYIEYADTIDLGYIYSCIGYAYKDQDSQRSKEYFLKSLDFKAYTSTYEHLADIEMERGNRESAYSYWEKAFALDDNSTPKDNLLYNMLQYDLSHGNTKKVCERIYNIILLKDSINNELKDRTIMEIQNGYDVSVAQHEIKEKQLWISVLILSLSIGLLLVVFYIKHRNAKSKLERAQHQITIRHYQWEIEGLKRESSLASQQIIDYKEKIAEVSEELRLSEAEDWSGDDPVNRLRQRIKNYKDKVQKLEDECASYEETAEQLQAALDQFIKEKTPHLIKGKMLFDDIMNNCKIQRWTKDDIVCFIEYYKATAYKSFCQIERNYTNLTDYNRLFLILHELGKDEKEIKEILSLSPSSIRVMKHRINQKRQ